MVGAPSRRAAPSPARAQDLGFMYGRSLRGPGGPRLGVRLDGPGGRPGLTPRRAPAEPVAPSLRHRGGGHGGTHRIGPDRRLLVVQAARPSPGRSAASAAARRRTAVPSCEPTRPRESTHAPVNGSRLSMAYSAPARSRNTATWRPSGSRAATPRPGGQVATARRPSNQPSSRRSST